MKRLPIEADEAPYLVMILDCLVENRPLLETGDVDLNRQFFQELKVSVDLMLRADAAINEDTRMKVMNALNLLVDHHAEYFQNS